MDHRWIGRIPPNDIRKDQDECTFHTRFSPMYTYWIKKSIGSILPTPNSPVWNLREVGKFTDWLRADRQKIRNIFMTTLREQLFLTELQHWVRGFTGYLVEVPVVLPGTSSCLDEAMKLLEGTLEESDAELRNSRRLVVDWEPCAHVVVGFARSSWPWHNWLKV